MHKKFICLTIVFFLILHPILAGKLITVSGFIRDAKTGEDLIGATVSIKELSNKGSGTNSYGYYSLTLPSGQYEITAQYMGYEPKVEQVDLTAPRKIDFLLTAQDNTLGEVVVT